MKKTLCSRILVGLLAVLLVFGGLKSTSLAAKKKLATPSGFTYSWVGDYYMITWNQVAGADYYYVILDGKKYKAGNSFKIQRGYEKAVKGVYQNQIQVQALDSTGKYKASDYIKCNYAVPDFDYTVASCYSEAGYLSEEQLCKYLKGCKNAYTTKTTKDYTIVDCSFKDEKNSGFWNGLGEVLDGALGGATDSLKENAGDIGKSATKDFIKGEGYDDTLNLADDYATEGALEGGFNALADNLSRDKNIHRTYYFYKGYEDLCSAYITYSYLAKNNISPSKLLTNWGYSYSKEYQCYYKTFPDRGSVIANYETSGTGNNKRYLITCVPAK